MNSYATVSFVSVLVIVMCNCYSGISTIGTTDIPFGGECEPNKSNCSECYILITERITAEER